MKFRDIMEKLKAGEITFDFFGHRPYTHFQDRLIDKYERQLIGAAGGHDGKWGPQKDKSAAEVDANMRLHYLRKLDWDITDGEIGINCDIDAETCNGCGQRFWLLLNGNKLEFRQYLSDVDNQFHNYPPSYRCPYEVRKPATAEITVAGPLLFANFFKWITDSPEEFEYHEDWKLDVDKGKQNITSHKAKSNVAFGQMSNMSVGIYVHPSNKSIIIGDCFIADRKIEEAVKDLDEKAADKEADRLYALNRKTKNLEVINNHVKVGEFHCAVWRWEAADFKTLGITSQKQFKSKHDMDSVIVDAVHGVWQLEHYFDTQTSPNEDIYSKLTLKE